MGRIRRRRSALPRAAAPPALTGIVRAVLVLAAAAGLLALTLPVRAGGEAEPAPGAETQVLPAGVRARVRLLPVAVVRGEQITLGEIAAIEGDDEDLLDRLQGLVVGRSPLPGASRRLSAGEIAMRLRQARLPLGAIELQSGDGGVLVQAEAQLLPAQQIKDAIWAAYDAQLERPSEAKLHLEVEVDDALLPAGAVEIVPDLAAIGWGRRTVAVDLRVDGRPARRLQVRVTAALDQLVPVALRSIARGELIAADDVVDQWRRVGQPVPPVEAGAVRAARHIRAGEVVDAGAVQPLPIIAQGDLVQIEAATEAVYVTALGIAQEDGWLGDVIAVRNESSGALVRAAVVGPGRVRVGMPQEQ